jgi:hypothetical protein
MTRSNAHMSHNKPEKKNKMLEGDAKVDGI